MWIIEATVKFARIVVHEGNAVKTFPTKEAAEAYLIGRIIAGSSAVGEWEAVDVPELPWSYLTRSI